MVLTRSRAGAAKKPDDVAAAPAPGAMLKAPPKRAGRPKKATAQPTEPEPLTEPAPKPAPRKITKPAVEAVPEPAAKPASKPAPKPAPKKATKSTTESAPEPAAEPAAEPAVETAPKKTAKGTRAAPKPLLTKSAATTATATISVATRATRSSRARAQDTVVESPLKAPARKPVRRTAAPKAKTVATPEEFSQPEPPKSPNLFDVLPDYPETPTHILAPISNADGLAELPKAWPSTPINATAIEEATQTPLSTPDAADEPQIVQDTLEENLCLPNTPKASETSPNALDETLHFPNTPEAPQVIPDALDQNTRSSNTPRVPSITSDALDETLHFPKTPKVSSVSHDALDETLHFPNTPEAAQASADAMDVTLGFPSTPDVASASADATDMTLHFPDTPRLSSAAPDALDETLHFPSTPQATTARFPSIPQEFLGTPDALNETPHFPSIPQEFLPAADALDQTLHFPSTPAPQAASTPKVPQSAARTPAPQTASTPKTPSSASTMPQDESTPKGPWSAFSEPQDESTPKATWNSPSTPVPQAASTPRAPQSVSSTPKTARRVLQEIVLVPESVMPKSAFRSPDKKLDTKTPKKTVTWEAPTFEDSEISMMLYPEKPLTGTVFHVDVTSKGRDQNYLFTDMLIQMGAKVVKHWTTETVGLTHVLFKDGSIETLKKVYEADGAVKCVNIDWLLSCEKEQKLIPESSQYLVSLSPARPPKPANVAYTPARTPSKYMLPTEVPSIPPTPTSSEFDRSITPEDEDKENSGIFFQPGFRSGLRTCPQPKFRRRLFDASPVQTPSKPEFLRKSPLRPVSTTKKRSADESLLGISMPPKKLRFT